VGCPVTYAIEKGLMLASGEKYRAGVRARRNCTALKYIKYNLWRAQKLFEQQIPFIITALDPILHDALHGTHAIYRSLNYIYGRLINSTEREAANFTSAICIYL
jgi:hypothetical protein